MAALSETVMCEAEVSLRLAMELARERTDDVRPICVSIDGAHVQVKDRMIFPLQSFMAENGWGAEQTVSWRGIYRKKTCRPIEIHAQPGLGDVIALLANGRLLRAESKKGPLRRSRSSQEFRLMHEAIGQLMTVSDRSDNDLLAIAVPGSDRFKELAERWTQTPLMRQVGIHILLVSRQGPVLVVAPDGHELILAEADDFDVEAEALRQSARFQSFLDRRTSKKSRIPIENIEKEIAQELERR